MVLLFLTLYCQHSYAQLPENFYTPYIDILQNSDNLEKRLTAQAHLIFQDTSILKDINITDNIIEQKEHQNTYRIRNQTQALLYHIVNQQFDQAEIALTLLKSISNQNDTLTLLLEGATIYRDSSEKRLDQYLLYKDFLFSSSEDYISLYKQYLLNELSLLYLNNTKTELALIYAEHALHLGYSKNYNPNLNIKSTFTLAYLLEELDDLPAAKSILLSTKLETEKYGTRKQKLLLYSHLGYVLSRLNEINHAKYFLLKNLDPAREIDLYKAISYSNLGLVYRYEDNLDSAIYYYTTAEKILVTLLDTGAICHVYIAFADAYRVLGDTLQFSRYIEKAKHFVKHNKLNLAEINILLARHHTATPEVSLAYVDTAISLLDENTKAELLMTYLDKKRTLLITLGRQKDAEIIKAQITEITKNITLSKTKSELCNIFLKSTLRKIELEKKLHTTQLALQRKTNQATLILIGLCAFTLLIITGFYYNKLSNENKRYIASIEAYQKEANLLADKTDLVINQNSEYIKKEISKELHDNILSAMSGLRMMSEIILVKNNTSTGTSIDTIRTMHEGLQSSYKDIEDYIDALRFGSKRSSSMQELNQLGPYIKSVLEPLEINALFTILFDDEYRLLSEQVIFQMERITKELINNIIKHADASLVTFKIHIKKSELLVTCLDNGKGFDTNKINARGLKNIKERVDTLAGQWTITSTPGIGTFVSIVCPL